MNNDYDKLPDDVGRAFRQDHDKRAYDDLCAQTAAEQEAARRQRARSWHFEHGDHQPDGTVRRVWHSPIPLAPSPTAIPGILRDLQEQQPEVQAFTIVVRLVLPHKDSLKLRTALDESPEEAKQLVQDLQGEAIDLLADMFGVKAERAK